ncbi:MAG TPA: 1-(5-phosphoribosyl)-5-[(5-phosphoribosylamino)methylideneamino]imidazole-4-carboxamide isomerase [Thermomicrobiales bacterium]|nr:1-(5-phosphoribosyl)-5-[(5-phosphoribosylamino)methylideneamino]imidazole-4-carboxamide isomerase [Thermomicrobiales bacterium]
MIVYPAIDIRGGNAVRLVEGDYNQETVFDADPADAARRWVEGGAEWIHLVDLDGARDGIRTNIGAIQRIRDETAVKLELGGGLRTMQDIDEVADLGIDRMIIGSAAIANPSLVTDAVSKYGDRIAVGLDARDGKLAAHGWIDQTDVDALEAARRFAESGVAHIIFTDIHRDGKLIGPNIDALRVMVETVPTDIIASGGVGTLNDVREIRDTGAAGVIIGAALYRGTVELPEVIRIATAEEIVE